MPGIPGAREHAPLASGMGPAGNIRVSNPLPWRRPTTFPCMRHPTASAAARRTFSCERVAADIPKHFLDSSRPRRHSAAGRQEQRDAQADHTIEAIPYGRRSRHCRRGGVSYRLSFLPDCGGCDHGSARSPDRLGRGALQKGEGARTARQGSACCAASPALRRGIG
jgi:hypothetical protein